MLSVEYQPQNLYCYSIDEKTDKTFKKRIRNLQNCFNNVIVNEKEYSVFSNGKNVTRSHLECLKTLSKHSKTWKYVFLLQVISLKLKFLLMYLKKIQLSYLIILVLRTMMFL